MHARRHDNPCPLELDVALSASDPLLNLALALILGGGPVRRP